MKKIFFIFYLLHTNQTTMPEGPEIWILNQAICNYYNDSEASVSLGKKLIISDKYNENNKTTIWSFGLNGKMSINENNLLYKPTEQSWIYGINEVYIHGISDFISVRADWMTSDENVLNTFIKKLSTKRIKLGPALIDQKNIAGIGVAWGSEILCRAGLRPDIPANQQDLSNLARVMIEIRDEIKNLYEEYLNNSADVKGFIQDWFENLYKIRNMRVYDVGEKIKINGRTWWI